MVKCIVDAALFKENHCFSVDMCIWDSRDHFIKARRAWYQGVSTPIEAEMGMPDVSTKPNYKLVSDGIGDKITNPMSLEKLFMIIKCWFLISQNLR